MSGIATAIVGGSLIGAVVQSDASRRAADVQRDAANAANDTQRYMYDQNRKDMTPWRDSGLGALQMLNQGMGIQSGGAQSGTPYGIGGKHGMDDGRVSTMPMGSKYGGGDLNRSFSMSDFQKDPGFDFRLSEGNKALERAAAARGINISGRTMKDLSRYGQEFASNEYQRAYDRFNADQSNRFNRLASMAGVGQAATQSMGNAGQNYASNYGNNLMGAANASSAGIMANANAINNAIGTGANTWMNYTMMNRMFPERKGG